MFRDKQLEIQMQFLEKATEYLNTLETVLFEVKLNRRISLQKIHLGLRTAHSIKGGASIMGFRILSDLAHRLEDSFNFLKIQNNYLEIDNDLHGLLLSGVDWLRQIVKLYSEGHTIDEQWLTTFCYPVFHELQERFSHQNSQNTTTVFLQENRLQNFISLLFRTEIEDCLQRLESLITYSEQSILRNKVATMASEFGDLGEMLQIQAFTQLCQSISRQLEATERIEEVARIALQAWRRSQALIINNQLDCLPTKIAFDESVVRHYPRLECISTTSRTKTVQIVEVLRPVSSNYTSQNQTRTMQVSTQQIEHIPKMFGELNIQQHSFQIQIERLHKLIRNLSGRVKNLERKNQELRINYDKFSLQMSDAISPYSSKDNYLEMSPIVLETIVKIQKLTTDIQLNLDDTNQVNYLLNETAQQLQSALTHVKVRPLSDIVERFSIALRNLCVEYGKNVELKIEGAETLVESSILEALNEPLIQLVHNAFDRGIEEPGTRRACGKPELGLIEIKAFYQSHRIIVTVRDDGRGISLNKIRVRAMAIGLEPSLLAQATDEELLSLIFEPGFSTSDEVSALSGRGIGMDVVCNSLKQIGGDVKVDTILGVGTTFTLSVPLLK